MNNAWAIFGYPVVAVCFIVVGSLIVLGYFGYNLCDAFTISLVISVFLGLGLFIYKWICGSGVAEAGMIDSFIAIMGLLTMVYAILLFLLFNTCRYVGYC